MLSSFKRAFCTVLGYESIPNLGYARMTIDPKLEIKSDAIETCKIRSSEVIANTPDHGLLALIHSAWMYHAAPMIKPDDVWLVITSELAKHVNEHTEYYREYLADKNQPHGKTIITIRRDHFVDLNDTVAMESVFGELITKINAKSSTTDLLPTLTCDFSTTTPITSLTSQVTLAYMVEEYFSMRILATCGIPYVDFMGTREDWSKIISKLKVFSKIAHKDIQEYLSRASTVIDNIIQVFDGSTNKKLQNEFYYSERCGSGGKEYRGWILGLINNHVAKQWSPYEASNTRIQYTFELVRDTIKLMGTKEFNDITPGSCSEVVIDIGPVGVKISSSASSTTYPTLELAYDYYLALKQSVGWTIDGISVKKEEVYIPRLDRKNVVPVMPLDLTIMENYDRVRYCGKKLHEYITQLPKESECNREFICLASQRGTGMHFICKVDDEEVNYYRYDVDFNKGTVQWNCRMYMDEEFVNEIIAGTNDRFKSVFLNPVV
jgi:hypothetical protein